MDTDRFEITLDHKEFYNSYINTIRKLYSESFIQKNNIMPSNEQSLAKTMLTTMGRAFDQYDAESFGEIIKRTNERYDKIKGSGIVGEVKEKVLRNITIFADIISSIMKEVGMYDLSEKFNCTSKKLLEENVTGNNLNEHVNDSIKNTESGIDELNGILDQISEEKTESMIPEEEDNIIESKDTEMVMRRGDTKVYLSKGNEEAYNQFKESLNAVNTHRKALADYQKSLFDVIVSQDKVIKELEQKVTTFESENVTLKKQLDEAKEQAASIPTDPEKRIELIKELISSHKDKAELKEILISFIVNL